MGAGVLARCGRAVIVATILAAVFPARYAVDAAHRPISGFDIVRSPRPVFSLPPSLAGNRVVWTATNGQGPGGSEADSIYLYDLLTHRVSTAVRSRYGANGFIGAYVLAGYSLAYVDTDVSPAGIFSWQVRVADLRHHVSRYIMASAPTVRTALPPQIAFDGVHLLILETVNGGVGSYGGVAILVTLRPYAVRTIRRVQGFLLGDPAVTESAALWTEKSFGAHPASALMLYDARRRALGQLKVGDVSQVAANDGLVVWKSGAWTTLGHITLYDLNRRRIVASNLARGTLATYPSIGSRLVAWTYTDGSRVQVYSVARRRIVFTSPHVAHRFYALTAAGESRAAWLYTVSSGGPTSAHGYLIVRALH